MPELLGVMVSVITVALWYYPNVSMVPGEIGKGTALNAPFTLTNNSAFLPIYDVESTCTVADFSSGGSTMHNISGTGWVETIPRMSSGEQASTYCKVGVRTSGNTDSADVRITVTYRPPFAWFHRTTTRRFVTTSDDAGNARWIPYGMGIAAPKP